MESSVQSSSSQTSDSWLFVKNINDEEVAGKNPEINVLKNSSEEMEDSDGISVISESEMYKNQTNSSDSEPEKAQIAEEIDQDGKKFEGQDEAKNKQEDEEIENDPDLLTPPSTPNNFNDEDQELQVNAIKKYEENSLKELESNETVKYHSRNHGVLLLIGMSLIIAVLYTNVSSLKSELAKTVSIYEQRILRLEEENQILRSQLDDLMKKFDAKSVDTFISKEKKESPPQKYQDNRPKQDDNVQQNSPITKKVWLGGENEEVVKILDKKYNSLPDYCYFTDENDLFYEYNKENCEKKKQKMENWIKEYNVMNEKYQKKQKNFVEDNNDDIKYNADDIWKSNDNMYNDYMSKTAEEILNSLNEEIQEIKSNRHTTPMANIESDDKKFNKKVFTKEKKIIQNDIYEGSASRFDSKDSKVKDEKYSEQARDVENDKPKKNKKKRASKRKDKDPSSGDWIERRTNGRENARLKKDSEENWYLKRQNEREINRLDTLRN